MTCSPNNMNLGKTPWSVSDAPKEFTQTLLSASVMFEIRVTAMEDKWKAGQNKPTKNRQGTVIAAV